MRDVRFEQDHLEETFRFKGGIAEYVEYLADDDPVTGIIRLEGEGHFTEHVPVLDGKGTSAPRTSNAHAQCRSRCAGQRIRHRDPIVRERDRHAERRYPRHRVRASLDQNGQRAVARGQGAARSEDSVTKDDITEGLTAVVTVRLAEPQFEGQTKEVLGTPQVTGIVSRVVAKTLTAWFQKPPGGERPTRRPPWTRWSMRRVPGWQPDRPADVQRRKNAWSPRRCRPNSPIAAATPPTTPDCSSSRGDSALGRRSRRGTRVSGLLPIRGKILNVQKASMADMLKNAECLVDPAGDRRWHRTQFRSGPGPLRQDHP